MAAKRGARGLRKGHLPQTSLYIPPPAPATATLRTFLVRAPRACCSSELSTAEPCSAPGTVQPATPPRSWAHGSVIHSHLSESSGCFHLQGAGWRLPHSERNWFFHITNNPGSMHCPRKHLHTVLAVCLGLGLLPAPDQDTEDNTE